MLSTNDLPRFTALLFGLSGSLVDFGTRTLSLGLLRSNPQCFPETLRDATHQPFEQVLATALQRQPSQEECQRLLIELTNVAREQAEVTPGVKQLLRDLEALNIPFAWQEDLPEPICTLLATPLDRPQALLIPEATRPWPAPDSCWQALSRLGIEQLDGCVLVSAQPRQLQAGLNAGLWTIGLAASGPLCGLSSTDWDTLDNAKRDSLRANATLKLYRLGVHSVIDHLGELQPCLQDLAVRRLKGEKP